VLHGVASGKRITLLDCSAVASTSYGYLGRQQGPDEQRVRVTTALVGVHLDDADDAVFQTCEVAIEDLTTWAAESPLTAGVQFEDERPTGGHIEATSLDARIARIAGLTLRLVHYQTIPSYNSLRGSTMAYIRHFATVKLLAEDSSALKDLRNHARSVQDLVSLGVHRAAGLLWMKLTLPPEDVQRPTGFPTLPREVSVYERPSSATGEPAAEGVSRGVLFTCLALPFETVVPRWFELRERYGASINLILALRYAPGGYLETQVSAAVTAAESMHRSLDLGPAMSKEEWTALKEGIKEAVPEGRRQWISERLGHNEPSLRQRLLQLAARPDPEAMNALLPDPSRWAQMATRARNDLAHTGRTSGHTLDDLYAVTKVTTAVVLLNILSDLGLAAEQQQRVLVENADFSTAARISRERCTRAPDAGGS
jgi:hypothetical protein